MVTRKFIIVLFIAIGLAFPKYCLAYEQLTHHDINKFVMTNMSSFLTPTLQNYDLWGTHEPLNGMPIIDIVANGGITEDNLPRPVNHFHNPLQSNWDMAGLKKYVGISDPVWAQDLETNTYSWPYARNYLYYALTASNQSERDTNFANCFRSLGQLMHLIEDMAVPAHTRDESHINGNIYEQWVEYIRQKYPNLFNSFLSYYQYTPDPSLFKIRYNPYATIPIAGLFDADIYNSTDGYTGVNPNVTTGAVGISEYTNANFFSEGTICQDFAFPSLSSTNVYQGYMVFTNPRGGNSTVDKGYYIKAPGTGDSMYYLATVGYLKDYVTNIIWQLHNTSQNWIFQQEIAEAMNNKAQLDDTCYTDYANRLIPRAVGYSSALLQYFFRGQIDMGVQEEVECPDENYDCATWNVNTVTLSLKNSTPDVSPNVPENMDGTLEVYYKFRQVYGQGDFSPNTLLGSYQVSLPVGGGYQQLVIPNLSFPENEGGEAQYTLVFRGTLGLESGAVVGRVIDFGFLAM